MRSRYILTGLLFFVARLAFTQTLPNEIPNNLSEYYSQRKEIAIAYALAHNMPIREVYSDGTIMEIQYLDESGKPLYFKTFNAEAASTTGTDKLYTGSDLGLSLSGKGVLVGIWDGGLVRATHIEFENRAQIIEGSSVSGHATHVTGTILAKGVNPSAKGMAFEANSINYDGLNGDASEMKNEAADGLVLSNHSYGSVLGWHYKSSNNSWEWVGDASISTLEDYRFGYYSSASAIWDDIAYDNPNYLIVKSAGNDGTDTGNGTGSPPDGPYDIIGPQGIAKNILTIGSVNGLSNPYSSPADIILADYSSWGPTDDGRIKPDIVAVGQNVFSASADGDDLYDVLSGTSMSSPNVTGSLALLQQLNYQQNNAYLSSAVLKALVIHTAHEAGLADGPDYQHGWGLLNMVDAAKIIMMGGNPGYMIKRDGLAQDGLYTLSLDLQANEKLTATLVWTDSAGEPETVAAVDPPTLKLVNDLDIRVTDESGTTYFPWIMNPVTKQASKGDNFRDNIEKIEIVTSVAGSYTISIGHKASLFNGSQDFALVISVGDLNQKLRPFYFVGSSSNFNDPINWSNQSGGASIGQIPGADDIIIFDDNSIGVLSSNSIQLADNLSCFSFAASGNLGFEIDLNGQEVSIGGKLSITNNSFLISNGTVNFNAQENGGTIQITPGSLANTKLIVSSNKRYVNLLSSINVDTLMILNGKVISNSFSINVNTMSIDNSYLDLGNSNITGINNFIVTDELSTLMGETAKLVFDGNSVTKTLVGGDNNFGIISCLSDTLKISKVNEIDSLNIVGKIILLDSVSARVILIRGSASLLIGNGKELNINESLVIDSSQGNRAVISTYDTGTTSNAGIRSELMPKFCYDFVDVENVDAKGNTKFVVGDNSILANSNGWIQGICQDILAAGFHTEFRCSGGVTYFIDVSDGVPDLWEWNFGDGSAVVTEQNPIHTYIEAGTYMVQLTVGKASENSSYVASIIIKEPNLGDPNIVLDNGQLRSTAFAPNYQWFFDNQPLVGETDFFLTNFSDVGSYHIEIWNDRCRLISGSFIITGLGDHQKSEFSIYPNPFTNEIVIRPVKGSIEKIVLRNLTGKIIYENEYVLISNEIVINTSQFRSGIYFIEIVDGSHMTVWRMVKIR